MSERDPDGRPAGATRWLPARATADERIARCLSVVGALGLALLVGLVLLVTVTGPTVARPAGPTPIDSCTVITESGEYVLTRDIRNSTVNDCITIRPDDVVLDGAGHTVDGVEPVPPLSRQGVRVIGDDRKNVTVRGLVLTGWDTGIRYLGSDGAIADTMISDSHGVGIHMGPGSDDNLVENTTIHDVELGIRITRSEHNTLRDVVVTDNKRGIWLTASNQTRLVDVTASANANADFVSGRDSRNTTATDFTVMPNTTVSFSATDVALKSIQSLPSYPVQYENIDAAVAVRPTDREGDARLNLSVRYTDAEVTEAAIEEGTFRMWQYDDGNWSQVADSSVDTAANVVSASVTDFGQYGFDIVAPVAEEQIATNRPVSIDTCTTLLASGEYLVTEDLRHWRPTCLRVESSDVIVEGDGHTIWTRAGHWGTTGVKVNASNVTVGNLTITRETVGIQLVGGTRDNTIRDNNMSYNYRGILIGRWSYVDGSHGNTVIRNIVSNSGAAGISLYSSRNNTVIRNTVSNSGAAGISLYSSRNNTLANNIVEGATGYGIYLWYSSNNSLAGNVVVNNTRKGGSRGISEGAIEIRSSDGNTLSSNFVGRNREDGIRVRESHSTVFVDNVVTDNGNGWGIVAGGHATLRNNTVSNNGAGITVGSNSTISHNMVESNAGYGIRSAGRTVVAENTVSDNDVGIGLSGAGARIVDNTVLGNDIDGIRLQRARNATIADNTVSNSRDGIRVITSRANRIVDNTVSGNERAGIRIVPATWNGYGDPADADSNVLRANIIRANEGTGIYVSAPDTTIAGNIVSNNSYGIRVVGSANNTVTNNTATDNEFDGVRLFSANGSRVINNTVSDNRFGIRLLASSNTVLADNVARENDKAGIRVTAVSWKGRGGVATWNGLRNNTVASNGVSGVRLVGTSDTTLAGTASSDNRYGVWLTTARNTTLTDAVASANSQWTVLLTTDAHITAMNLTLASDTVISFESTDAALGSVTSPPPDPAEYANIGKYVEMRPTDPAGWLALNVSYTDADLADADVDERTLRLWRYDGSWSQVSGSDVDTARDVVFGNVTNGGVIAPLGEEGSEQQRSGA